MTKSEKQISIFAKNLKFLRNRKKKFQEDVALALEIGRSKLASYESGNTVTPPLEDLKRIRDYYQIGLDFLICYDLSTFSELKLREIEFAFASSSGTNLRIIAVTVDKNNKENIEYVPLVVKAGYLAGYSDPEFISELPKVSLPFVKQGKTTRLFECEGDSMLPLPDKCKVLGEYVEDYHNIKDGDIYIIISYKEGFAIKRVFKRLENNSLTLQSLNPIYPEYEMYLRDISEIWKFKLFISDKFPQYNLPTEELIEKVEEMREILIRGRVVG